MQKMYVSHSRPLGSRIKSFFRERAKEIALEMDNKLMQQDQMPAYLNEIQGKINKLNSEFKWRKPLAWDINFPDRPNGSHYVFICFGVFRMEIYEVKPYDTKVQ